MALTGKQKRHLRALGNKTESTVVIGHTGVTDSTLLSINLQLAKDELVKVKLNKSAGLERKAAAANFAEDTDSELVQVFGSTILLYKAHPSEPVIKLPKPSKED